MWRIVVFVSVVTVDLIDAGSSAHGWCLLFNKRCVTHCPRYMHPYYTRCDIETITQRTCSNPVQHKMGFTCGWSRCDCNSNLVFDEDAVTCVELERCTMQMSRREYNKKQRLKAKNSYHVPKHLELNPDRIPEDRLQ